MPNPVPAGLPNPASYDTTTPGVVLDKVTGLTWQRAVDAGSYSWAAAKAYCAALTLAGQSDWRLPTEIELFPLVDYTVSSPAIDGTAFPNTPAEFFCLSSQLAGQPSSAWEVYFGDGYSSSFDGSNATRPRRRSRPSPSGTRARAPGVADDDLDSGLGIRHHRQVVQPVPLARCA